MKRGGHERERELMQIQECVDAVSMGTGCVVVIEGRGGAGKTALLDAGTASCHAAGHYVRTVRARQHERSTPGATLRRLGLASASTTSWREIAGLTDAGPAVVAVDDFHLADDESIAALVEIADRIEDLALLMLVGLRPGEWPADDPRLDRLRGSAGASVLRPAALSPLGVARILEDHWGFAPSDEVAEAQAAWTGGNPRLVTASRP